MSTTISDVNSMLDQVLNLERSTLTLESGEYPKFGGSAMFSYPRTDREELEGYLSQMGMDPRNPLKNTGITGGFYIVATETEDERLVIRFRYVGKRDQSEPDKMLAVDLSGRHLRKRFKSYCYRDSNKTSKAVPLTREYEVKTIAHLRNGSILVNGGELWLRPDTELIALSDEPASR